MRLRSCLVAVVALLSPAVVAAPADAQFRLHDLAVAPADTTAGAATDVRIAISVDGGELRDLDLHFPPGLVGNPRAATRCPRATFAADRCPRSAQVGSVSVDFVVADAFPSTAPGEIYNLEPRGSEVARIGTRLRPNIAGLEQQSVHMESPIVIRTEGDGGLSSSMRDIPRSYQGMKTTIRSMRLVLRGQAGDPPRDFMSNPTGCAEAVTRFDARAWDTDARADGRAAFTPVKCESLPFAPGFTAAVRGGTRRDERPVLLTSVTQGPGESNPRDVVVTLPPVFVLDLEQLGRACEEEAFRAGQCPPSARIGTATATTPFYAEPLAGPVMLVAGEEAFPDVITTLTSGPLTLLVRGATGVDDSGSMSTSFTNLPDVPQGRFDLELGGNGIAPMLSLLRDICTGPLPRLTARFTAHSGATRTVTTPAPVAGCRPHASLRLRGTRRRPALRLRVRGGRDGVRRVRVRLPSALRFRRGARRHVRVTGSTAARRAVVRARGRSLAIRLRKSSSQLLAVTVPRRALAARRPLRGRLRFAVEMAGREGPATRQSLSPRPPRR